MVTVRDFEVMADYIKNSILHFVLQESSKTFCFG